MIMKILNDFARDLRQAGEIQKDKNYQRDFRKLQRTPQERLLARTVWLIPLTLIVGLIANAVHPGSTVILLFYPALGIAAACQLLRLPFALRRMWYRLCHRTPTAYQEAAYVANRRIKDRYDRDVRIAQENRAGGQIPAPTCPAPKNDHMF